MRSSWGTFAMLLCCGLPLTACIIVPESTRQVESTTRVYVNDRARDTQVEISRPQVIIVQPQFYPYPPMPRPPRSNCHIQSNGLSMPPFPVVCD